MPSRDPLWPVFQTLYCLEHIFPASGTQPEKFSNLWKFSGGGFPTIGKCAELKGLQAKRTLTACLPKGKKAPFVKCVKDNAKKEMIKWQLLILAVLKRPS
ncbi:MAG: hypothetical protein K9M45_03940 [Kiritimatiellales bacterium]|nr:hypothetical protein [Kiritimatiellales bacterium]